MILLRMKPVFFVRESDEVSEKSLIQESYLALGILKRRVKSRCLELLLERVRLMNFIILTLQTVALIFMRKSQPAREDGIVFIAPLLW